MKTIIIIIITIQSICAFSQEKTLNVEYEIFYNTDIPNTQFANLYINNTKEESIYIKKSNTKTNSKVVKEEDNSISLQFNSKKNNSNYFNLKKDTLYSTENLFGEDYIIIEKAPKLEWQLTEETKIKDSITLSKATCEFRGRKYIAWYSIDYPLKYGPWKLQGLPGLIFEVYDETKRYLSLIHI
jgi:GLPGLI family protein